MVEVLPVIALEAGVAILVEQTRITRIVADGDDSFDEVIGTSSSFVANHSVDVSGVIVSRIDP